MILKLFPFPAHVEKFYLTRVTHFQPLKSFKRFCSSQTPNLSPAQGWHILKPRSMHFSPEPGISGLEKTAPPSELEFSSRSN